jgi:hypothetical protein
MRSHDEKNRGTTKKDWVWKRKPARHAALHDLVPWQHLPVEGEVPSHFTGASYPSRSLSGKSMSNRIRCGHSIQWLGGDPFVGFHFMSATSACRRLATGANVGI